ncbi:hypothetical protein BAPA111461_01035 [Bacillus paramycoides]
MFCNTNSIQNKIKNTGINCNSYGLLFLYILFRINIWHSSATIKHPPTNTSPEVIVIRSPAFYSFHHVINIRYICFIYTPFSSIKPDPSMKDLARSVNFSCNTFISFTFLCFIISSNVKYVFVPYP